MRNGTSMGKKAEGMYRLAAVGSLRSGEAEVSLERQVGCIPLVI